MRLRVFLRMLQIQRVLLRHGLDDYVRATHLYRPVLALRYLAPWTWFDRSAGRTRGERGWRLGRVEGRASTPSAVQRARVGGASSAAT